MMKNKLLIVLLTASCYLIAAGICEEKAYNAGVESKTVFKSTSSVLGQPLFYPVTNIPEVTGLKVIIHPGEETGWHTHSVPGYAYIISGELKLLYEGGTEKVFKAGDAFAEVVNTPHNGRNEGKQDIVLIVFFTAEAGVPFTKKVTGRK